MKIRLFLLLFLISPLLQAEIFKWVDDEGNVHFSDQNQKGSRPVELTPPTIIGTKAVPSSQPQAATPQTEQKSAVVYESVEIVKPTNDESLRLDGDGVVNVTIESSPGLADGNSYRLSLNGDVIENSISTGQVPLKNLDRGSHTLKVEIIDKAGNSLISSEEIIFHVLRVANAPRPTPR